MKIKKINSTFESEPLKAPFGFKGGHLSELWQSIATLEDEDGNIGIGLGTQSVLWSDAEIFSSVSEADGNNLMFKITAFALGTAKNIEWSTPIDLLDQLLEPSWNYAKKISGHENLRLTFVLNALVAVDNAAWQLYSKAKGINNFDEMLPCEFRKSLSCHNDKLACVPLMTYGVPIEEIIKIVDEGYFFLKIKIGSDPDKDGDLDKMLEWDKQRLSEIHEVVKDRKTEFTDGGHIPYYLDANGRYDSKERLISFLDHAKKIGALERIILLEEPFPEEMEIDVSDIPVRLAADESAHSDKDALKRIELGYGAIALKPIAKTMSMSLKIANIAAKKNIPCFCADLTVNPILVDWNKNVAARLAPLPGMKIGVLESNGHQNYKNWEKMKSYHPYHEAEWTNMEKGLFHLNEEFYRKSGGIFDMSKHYS